MCIRDSFTTVPIHRLVRKKSKCSTWSIPPKVRSYDLSFSLGMMKERLHREPVDILFAAQME